MNRLLKRKRGISLIEIVISIAILAIISIPISGMIITSVKTNKSGEDKQKATLLGQQILEEIRSTSIDIKNDEVVLNTGVILSKSFNEADGKYRFDTENLENEYDGLKANVTLKQYLDLGLDENFVDIKYDEEVIIDKQDANFIVNIKDEEVQISEINEIKIRVTNNQETIQLNINGTLIGPLNKTIGNKNGFLKVKLNNEDIYSKLSIEVINNRDDSMNLYFDNNSTSNKDTKDIFVENSIGAIKRVNNWTENDKNFNERQGTMFEVKVFITKGSSKLFEGSAIKNIYIY